MKTKTLFILTALMIFVSACQPKTIPISGSYAFYYSWKCDGCDQEIYGGDICVFVEDRFACGDGTGGWVEFDGTVLTLRYEGNVNAYWGEFQDDGTISGVMADPGMEKVGIWWLVKK